MQKKPTDARVDACFHTLVGRGRIRGLIERFVHPHVLGEDVGPAYRQMGRDEAREAKAREWSEATVGDVAEPAE